MKLRSLLSWILTLTALTPLLVVDGLFYPFMLSKAIVFKSLVVIALLVWAISLLKGERYNFSILKRKVVLLPVLFLLVQMLAALFGIDPYHSFWSLFDRMDGVVMTLHLTVFFYLCALVFDEKQWLRYLKAIGWTGSFIALYSLGQAMGIKGLIESGGDRVVGTIGNAGFLASYLVLSATVVGYLAKKSLGGWRVFWAASAVLQGVVIVLTGTRGAFVGLMAAGVVACILAVWKGQKRTKVIAGSLIVVGIMSALLIGVFRDTLKDSSFRPLARVASISLEDATTKSRLFVWKHTLTEVIPTHPLLGVGPENFEIAYNQFFDPQVVAEEWFDRAHNMYLDIAATSGLAGLAVYLLILTALIQSVMRKYKAGDTALLVFGIGLVAYLVQNLFIFDVTSTHVLFWALAAWLLSNSDSTREEKAVNRTLAIIAVVLALLAVGSLWVTSWKPLRANLYLAEAYKYQIVDSARSDEALRKGLALGTFADIEYGYQMYNMYFNKRGYPGFPAADLKASFDLYATHLAKLVEKYPLNARHLIYLGHIYEGRPEGVVVDEEKQEMMLKRAEELSPMRPQPHYMLANIHLARSVKLSGASKEVEIAEALSILKSYSEQVPRFAEAAAIYGTVLFNNAHAAEAVEPMSRAMKYFDNDPSVAKRIVSYLLRSNRAAETEKFLEVVVAAEPTNYETAFDLAKVYALNKKYGQAVEILNQLQEKAPELLDREPFNVQQILRGYNAGRAL